MIPFIRGHIVYAFGVGEDEEICEVCGETDCICHNHYDCADCFECEHDCDEAEETGVSSDDGGYKITVKVGVDSDEVDKFIENLEIKMDRVNDMFDKLFDIDRFFI